MIETVSEEGIIDTLGVKYQLNLVPYSLNQNHPHYSRIPTGIRTGTYTALLFRVIYLILNSYA